MLSGDWVVLFAIIAAVGVLLSQPALVGLGSMVLLAWGLAWAWSRLALARIIYRRSLSQSRAFPGERVQLRLEVTNHKSLPLPWLQVRDAMPFDLQVEGAGDRLPLEQRRVPLNYSTSLSWYEKVSWSVPLRCPRRGLYRFGPATIASGDIFGLFRSEMDVASTDQLLVYPRVVRLPELGLPAQKPFGEIRGGDRIFEDPTRMMGLRDYRQDDPRKKIDWKASARRGELQVRVYEPTIAQSLFVLLNAATTLGESRWGFAPELLERAVTVAASVASHAFEERYSVGLMTNAHSLLSDAAIKIPPSRDPSHLSTLLEALASVGPLSSSTLEEMLWGQIHHLPLGATLLLVTAVLPESLLDTLLDMRRRGHHIHLLWVGDTPLAEALEGGIRVYDIGRHVARLMAEAEEAEREA